MDISEETLVKLKYIFKLAYRKLGVQVQDDNIEPTFYLFQPLLINIINQTKKGCNVYYRYLRKKVNLNSTMSERETKWHNELNCVFGIEFWNRIYGLTASIKNENKMKYLQYQINRNSLFTNYRVNKFKPFISPFCTFCSTMDLDEGDPAPHLELISHLFFECNLVLNLWTQIKDWLKTLNIDIPLDRKSLLFGCQDQPSKSVPNYIILCNKYFIWKSKFQTQDLQFISFKQFLKYKIDDIKNAYFFEKKDHLFDPWLMVYNNLTSI